MKRKINYSNDSNSHDDREMRSIFDRHQKQNQKKRNEGLDKGKSILNMISKENV